MIVFSCPACRKKLSVQEALAGKKGKCPHCGHAVAVPERAGGPSLEDMRTLPPAPARARDPASAPTNPPSSSSAVTGGGASVAVGFDSHLIDFLSPPQSDGELGWLGKYRILKVLGHGGMGVVFQAEDPRLKRAVAIKAMLPALAASASAGQRFLREAQAMAAVEHDHIVRVYQVDEDRGVPFLAMEFLKGEPLDERLRREQALPVPEVLRIGRETAEALAAAHERGLIHRDVKPANVWLEAPRGRVKLLDFGLARATSESAALTQQGAIIGTPAYMAPEQGRGEPVDHRGDLFSLGVVLYRLSTGRQPFEGRDTVSTLLSVVTHEPPPPAAVSDGVPPVLSDLVMKLLEKDASRRPAAAAEVVQALQALEEDLRERKSAAREKALLPPTLIEKTTLTPPAEQTFAFEEGPTPERPAKGAKQKRGVPVLPALIGGGVLLAGFLAAVFLWPKKGEPPPVPAKGASPVSASAGAGTAPAKANGEADEAPAELHRFTDHRGGVWCVACSADGKVGLSGGGDYFQDGNLVVAADYDVRQWDLTTGKLVRKLSAHTGTVKSVAISKDGKVGASGSWDRTVSLWDLQTGRELLSLEGHTDKVTGVALSDDGRRVLTCALDGSMILWDAGTGKELNRLTVTTAPLWSAALSADGTRAVGGCGGGPGKDFSLRLWEAVTGRETSQFVGHSDGVHSVAFSPDGRRILGGEAGGDAIVWDAATGGIGHRLPGHAVCFSADGTRALTGCNDSTVRLWATGDWRELSVLRGHTRIVQGVALSADGRRALTGSWDGTVRCWRLPR
jgi:serine/threonine protein kinase